MIKSAVGHEQAHHWETSVAPMLVVAGVLFLVVFGFIGWFSYHSALMAIVSAGIGVPLLLAGIAKWTGEGLTHKPLVEGLSPMALSIFIVSEIFIFLSLFAAYWTMRLSAGADWPPVGTPKEFNLVLPLIMTVILVTSSLTYHVAEVKLEQNNLSGFRGWVFISILLGLLFLGCTVYEYQHLMHQKFTPSTNAYSTAFYSITGFHASHVLIGLGVFLAVLLAAMRGLTNKYLAFCAGLYWHFVDIVWFFVATQIYYW
ncbi:MAG: heme-copper oxidase subunit III [Magnetococcales bacterium]|nr:heme-copper oxidase subunit III [Magnetococcales bacterium]